MILEFLASKVVQLSTKKIQFVLIHLRNHILKRSRELNHLINLIQSAFNWLQVNASGTCVSIRIVLCPSFPLNLLVVCCSQSVTEWTAGATRRAGMNPYLYLRFCIRASEKTRKQVNAGYDSIAQTSGWSPVKNWSQGTFF